MNKTLKKINGCWLAFFFIISLFFIDLAVGKVIEYLYFHVKSGQASDIVYDMTHLDQELLVLGSSRACQHYVPSELLSVLPYKSCRNAGIVAQSVCTSWIFLHNCKEKPQTIILEMTGADVIKTQGTFSVEYTIQKLAPFYNQNEDFRKLCKEYNWKTYLLNKSFFYRYNSKILMIVKGLLSHTKSDQGYVPLYGKLPENTEHINNNSKNEIEYDPIKIAAFKNIIQFCKENEINLIVVSSPAYTTDEPAFKYIAELTEENNIPYIDCRFTPEFQKPSLFYDHGHLNNDGAILWSRYIAERIKNLEETQLQGENVSKN